MEFCVYAHINTVTPCKRGCGPIRAYFHAHFKLNIQVALQYYLMLGMTVSVGGSSQSQDFSIRMYSLVKREHAVYTLGLDYSSRVLKNVCASEILLHGMSDICWWNIACVHWGQEAYWANHLLMCLLKQKHYNYSSYDTTCMSGKRVQVRWKMTAFFFNVNTRNENCLL